MTPVGASCPECHAPFHLHDCARLARMPEGLRKVVRRGEELRRNGLRVYGNQLLDASGRPVSNAAATAILRDAGLLS